MLYRTFVDRKRYHMVGNILCDFCSFFQAASEKEEFARNVEGLQEVILAVFII